MWIWQSPFLRMLMGVVLCVAVACGCGGSSPNSEAGSGRSTTAVENGEPPGPQFEPDLPGNSEPAESGNAVTVQVADKAGLDAVIAKHKGHVVLVDYWGTWCPPCRKKFKLTVELSRKYQAQGLSVVSVAMDNEEDQAEVEKFLVEHDATFDNLRSQSGASDEAFELFDIPNGALPCLRVFDRSGQLHKTFAIDPDAEKQFTFEEVEASVAELLAEKL